jgi:hypothetical protein
LEEEEVEVEGNHAGHFFSNEYLLMTSPPPRDHQIPNWHLQQSEMHDLHLNYQLNQETTMQWVI